MTHSLRWREELMTFADFVKALWKVIFVMRLTYLGVKLVLPLSADQIQRFSEKAAHEL